MTKAYLQNTQRKYYTLKPGSLFPFKNEVILVDEKTPLVNLPKELVNAEKKETPSVYNKFDQIRFDFTGDGYIILATLVFGGVGVESDCVLTLEGDQNICGNLDFITMQANVGKSFEIACIPF